MSAVSFIVLCYVVVSGSSANINSFIEPRVMFSFAGPMNKELIDSISSGVQLAMDQCRNDFKWEKWNCPESAFSRHSTSSSSTRETAYTKAILAAGIVHAITKNCSRGEISGCGCDPYKTEPSQNKSDSELGALRKGKDWIWGGCSDDVTYAVRVAKMFLNSLEKGSDLHATVGKHNYHMGRKVVQNSLTRKCVCHGISCSLQTCWMQLAPFSEVSKKLNYKYKKAVKISLSASNVGYSANSLRRKKINSTDFDKEDNLMFLEQSPDYCMPDAIKDWPGTKGRRCSRNRSKESDVSERKSCKELCRSCGYKVKRMEKREVRRCNCSFKWCCAVKCEICVDTVDEFVCT